MLLADMYESGSFVMAGDVSGWCSEFLHLFAFTILLKAPKDLRMQRIKHRKYANWGGKVLTAAICMKHSVRSGILLRTGRLLCRDSRRINNLAPAQRL